MRKHGGASPHGAHRRDRKQCALLVGSLRRPGGRDTKRWERLPSITVAFYGGCGLGGLRLGEPVARVTKR
jgi:hypothetical protein